MIGPDGQGSPDEPDLEEMPLRDILGDEPDMELVVVDMYPGPETKEGPTWIVVAESVQPQPDKPSRQEVLAEMVIFYFTFLWYLPYMLIRKAARLHRRFRGDTIGFKPCRNCKIGWIVVAIGLVVGAVIALLVSVHR